MILNTMVLETRTFAEPTTALLLVHVSTDAWVSSEGSWKNSFAGNIDWFGETRLETNMCHRAESALVHERANVESEYNTEMFRACFDFDSAPLTAVASLAPVWIARSARRGRVEGLIGATLHLEEMTIEETMSILTDTR